MQLKMVIFPFGKKLNKMVPLTKANILHYHQTSLFKKNPYFPLNSHVFSEELSLPISRYQNMTSQEMFEPNLPSQAPPYAITEFLGAIVNDLLA